MLIPNKFNGYHNGTRQLHISSGGGGGGGTTQTTSTVQNTNIPSYAQPYVESMLGATQKQLFNTKEVGGTPEVKATYDSEGNQLTAGTAAVPGYTELTGFKPYQAYGGTYDAQGNQLSYDPSKGIAGINDMQQQAYMNMYGMKQDPNFDVGSNMVQQAGQGAMSSAADAMRFGNAGFASGQKGQELGIAGGQKYGEMGTQYGTQGANLGIAGGAKYGEMGAGYGAQAAGLSNRALGYGDTGAGYGAQAAELANTALGYGQKASDLGQLGLMAGFTGQDVARQSQALARQQAGAGAQYAQMATDPRVTQALMSPYTQNVLDVQNRELQRGADIAGTVRGAQAARAGAFGGSRQAIENAEAQRNLATIKNANTAQALQQAFQQAQAQQQFGANLNLQGLAGAQQGLGTALSGGQLGLSGIGTALQGQQGALSGVGQAGAMYGLGMQGTQTGLSGVNAANQAYQTGIQGAGMGLQGVNTQLAGTAQGMQGAQVGLQGVDRQLAGTAQGMQGAQVGLQGVQGAQAGYGLANQAGANVANIANQSQAAQQALLNNQMQMGNQKMAYDQSIKNQAVQDYANAQQYPLMQLGTMSNMLRGLPMQASTTNQYAASPNPVSQAVGTIGAGASIYNAMKPGGAAGGLPSEFKYAKGGGIMSYDMGGEVEEQLESMDEKGLQTQARESSSPSIRKMAQRLLRERQMSKQPQGVGPMGVQYQAAQPQMPSYAPGGIVAFQQGAGGNGVKSAIEEGGEDEAKIGMADRLIQPAPTTGGIMGATTQPTTPVPVAPPKPLPDIAQEAMRQRDIYSAQATRPTAELLKEIQAEREALGVGDNKPREELRAQQMAERANLADEKERQRHMRLAEFFASWGSTPGPVLVAGMNALKQSIPGIISDEKEAKKARKEADKIIYDIDEATRLEKLGMHKEAVARKEKAASHAEDYNKYLLSLQGQREGNERAIEAAKIQAAASIEGHRISAASHGASSAAANKRADEATRNNFQRQALETKRAAEKLETDIAKEAKDTLEYTTAKRMASTTKIDKKQREKAEATIKEYETNWTNRRQAAKDDLTLAQEQLKEINQRLGYGKKPDNAGGGGAAADRPSIASFQR